MKGVAVTIAFAAALAAPATASDSDQQLAETLVPLIRECMVVPEHAKVSGATAVIEIELQKGRLASAPRVIKQPQTPDERSMLRAAIRAARQCSPYPANISMTIQVGFEPNE